MSAIDIIQQLKPTTRPTVMSLVSESGIDVTDWATIKDKSAASNPKYCYEWVFTGDGVVTLCLWHSALIPLGENGIGQRLNLWGVAREQEKVPKRSIVARRARNLDVALQMAYNRKLPLRVILVDGKAENLAVQSVRSSKVEFRLLDESAWFVTEYNFDNGECLIERGAPRGEVIDQFDIRPELNAPVRTTSRNVTTYSRSPLVRRTVLARSGGACEYCGKVGFATESGSIYLETHHLVSLCDGGADSTFNVVALCADHHREAHLGKDKNQITSELVKQLQELIAK